MPDMDQGWFCLFLSSAAQYMKTSEKIGRERMVYNLEKKHPY